MDKSNIKGIKISVLIIAYERKEFIKEAILSVLDQTIPRNQYEIICIVGFKDEEISTFLKENNITEIYCHCRIGKNLSMGLNSCKGDYVVFLEDDDKFTRDKLELVLKAFENNNIIYYHNNHEIIDKYSQTLNQKRIKFKDIFKQFTQSITWDPPHRYHWIGKYGGAFNLSSIAVSTTYISKYNSVLAKIESAADFIVFSVLLQDNFPFYFDVNRTTLYRMHENSETHSIERNHEKLIDHSKREYRSALIVYESLNSEPVKRMFVEWLLSLKFYAYVAGIKDLKPSFIDKLKLFYYGITAPNPSYLISIIAVVVYSMFPKYVDKLAVKRTTKIYKISYKSNK
jgi:glycosyltransferase involved in cell wall biosynthesis